MIKNTIIYNKKNAYNERNKEKNILNRIKTIIIKIIIDYKNLTINKNIIINIKIIKITLLMKQIKLSNIKIINNFLKIINKNINQTIIINKNIKLIITGKNLFQIINIKIQIFVMIFINKVMIKKIIQLMCKQIISIKKNMNILFLSIKHHVELLYLITLLI